MSVEKERKKRKKKKEFEELQEFEQRSEASFYRETITDRSLGQKAFGP